MKLNLKKKCLSKHILILLLVCMLLPLSFLTNIKPAQATSNGKIFWFVSDWLLDGSTPNSVAQRIVSAKLTYGQPCLIVCSNFGGRHTLVSTVNPALVTLFHSVGIQVFQQVFSAFYSVSVEPLTLAEVETQINQQLAQSPTIDGFYIDEVAFTNDAGHQTVAINDYGTLHTFIDSKGKLECSNHSGWVAGTSEPRRDEILGWSDIIEVEEFWLGLPNSLDKGKVWGVEAPRSAHGYDLTTLNQAVADTDEAFGLGLGYFMARHSYLEEALPYDFEGYLNNFPLTIGQAPKFGSHSVSTNLAGQSATFVCAWTDDYGLSQGILCENYTGHWHNQTAVTLSGTSASFSDLAILPNQGGKVLAYRFYAKDTSNLWNVTSTYYLVVIASSPPAPPVTPPSTPPTIIYVYPTWHFGYITSDAYITFEAPLTLDAASRVGDYWFFNDYGFQTDVNMTITNFFTNNQLVYNVIANSTGVTNFIYLASRGMPISVLGTQVWSYDPASKIITLQVTGSGTVTVTLIFEPLGGGFSLPYWLPFLLRAAAILIPFGIIAYYFSKIRDVKSGTLTVVVILTCFIIFFIMWYFAMAIEGSVMSGGAR